MPLATVAQRSVPLPRITTSINEAQRSPLKGDLHPLARPQNDRGAADPSLLLPHITMAFQPTAAQQADLDALLAAQQNPTSASFHQWLTPQQYGERFGIAPADLAKVASWLQSMGFTVVEIPASRNFIVFSGTAGQVRAAFHADIHNYEARGQKFYANSSEPSVPAALAGLVVGFHGLNNFRLKPRAVLKKMASSIQSHFTSGQSGNNFISPDDFATVYDLNPLYSASPAIDGTGQKIVIVGQSQVRLNDIANFRQASGLAPNVPQVHFVGLTDPGIQDGDVQESSLDIEWAGAVARNATIIFVYGDPINGGGVFDAIQYAISGNVAPVISISYGGCETTFSAASINAIVALAQQANAQGITITSSIGDGGATDCDTSLPTPNYPAQLGLNVDFPGSMPYITAVGGTEFNEGNGSYWKQETPGTDIISSALSYVPEMVWNDTFSDGQLSAGGGGASSIFGKPSWQTGTGVPSDGARDVPDIAIDASDAHDPYLVCTVLPGSGPSFVSGCQNGFRNSSTDLNFSAYGGTSFGAPTFAGILALINQKTNSSGQGNINYILYPLAASAPSAFHDIGTGSGDNKSPCIAGTQDCPNGGSIGFSAGTGYDQATGLGSIDATNLVNLWSTISASAGSTPVLSSISPTSKAAGAADFTLTATGSSFATNAQILWNGSTAGVTMLPGGTSTTIAATISHTLVAYGTTASVTVTDDAATAGEASASQTFTVNGVAPVNDNIANAIAVTSSAFTSTVDNSAATTESTDPTPPCITTSTNTRTKTVWWSLTPSSSSSVLLSTIGSVYDTTISVWTGSPGSQVAVPGACNDDVSSGQYTQSLLTFSATAGTKYFIMVAPFGPPDSLADQAGGKTVLNVSNGNPSALSISPSSQSVTAGSSATYVITNTAITSYVLTCSGLPTGASCGAATVLGNSTVSLVITTTSRTAGAIPSLLKRPNGLWPLGGTIAILGIILSFLVFRKGRRLAMVPMGATALLLLFFAIGCGSSSSSGGGGITNPNGTPAGSYSVTVTGTSGSSTQTTSLNLKVT